MTPFGARLRALREARGVSQAELAAALHVSPAYLSALEHGHRGRPSPGLIHQVNEFFGLIWDDAEEMVRLARRLASAGGGGHRGAERRGDRAGQPAGAGYPRGCRRRRSPRWQAVLDAAARAERSWRARASDASSAGQE